MDLDHAPWCEAKEPREIFSLNPSLGVNDGKRPIIFRGKMGNPTKIEYEDIVIHKFMMYTSVFWSKYQVLLQISRLHQRGHIEIHHYVALKNHPFGSIILIQLANMTKSTYIYCKSVLTGCTSPFFSRPSVIAILRTANPAESFSAGPHRCSASAGLSAASLKRHTHPGCQSPQGWHDIFRLRDLPCSYSYWEVEHHFEHEGEKPGGLSVQVVHKF